VVAAAATATAEPHTYVVDPAQSTVRVHVGRAGLFSFAGHEHDVAATEFAGEVQADPANVAASTVRLVFDTAGLKVLPEGEPAGDPPKVEEAMRSAKVLDVARFPQVTFQSRAVAGKPGAGGAYDLEVTGDLVIRGITRAMTLPVKVELQGETLVASGRTVLRHDQFGMQPVSVAGVVKVKNEIVVSYKFVARANAVK
jgi:polyisoprenoid-binding protein YceI